jgi:small subunit ribosomal protein S16
MVVIRLSRRGAKDRPFYYVVVADSRCPRDGRFIEKVGYFNPIAAGQETKLHLEVEAIEAWIAKGAQPSDRVASLLKSCKKS